MKRFLIIAAWFALGIPIAALVLSFPVSAITNAIGLRDGGPVEEFSRLYWFGMGLLAMWAMMTSKKEDVNAEV